MLFVITVETDVITLVLNCTKHESFLPPGIASAIAKSVIGIVTNTDLAPSEEKMEQARSYLQEAGASEIFNMSVVQNFGLVELEADFQG